MVSGINEGRSITAPRDRARGRLELRRDDLQAALDGDLSARHRSVLEHIEILEHSLAEIETYILAAALLQKAIAAGGDVYAQRSWSCLC